MLMNIREEKGGGGEEIQMGGQQGEKEKPLCFEDKEGSDGEEGFSPPLLPWREIDRVLPDSLPPFFPSFPFDTFLPPLLPFFLDCMGFG